MTQQDIARAAGVSRVAVSLALRNDPSISAALRARIQQLAAELKYTPDPMLSALSAYTQQGRNPVFHATLAWLTNYPTREGWKASTAFTLYLSGARAQAERLGYKIEEFWLREPGHTAERWASIFEARNITGILLPPQPAVGTEIVFPWERFSAVAFGYTLAQPTLHLVTSHQFRCMMLALRELRKLGYARIGLAINWDARVEHNWGAAFLIEQDNIPPADAVPRLAASECHPAGLFSWMKQWRPQVIIGMPVMKEWLTAKGYAIPDDVGFVEMVAPPAAVEKFSGIDENSAFIGAAGVDLLIGMLHRRERGLPVVAKRLLIEGTWVRGNAVRELRAAADRPQAQRGRAD